MPKKKGPVLVQLVEGVECVTVAEAARRLKCSRQNVWTRVKRKTIKAILVGDHIFIPVEALSAKAG